MIFISERQRVPLTDKSSGYFWTDAEKVAGVALMLGSVNVAAISDITGIKKYKVKWLLTSLQNNDWEIEGTLSDQWNDRLGNLTENQQLYPVLRMKGVLA